MSIHISSFQIIGALKALGNAGVQTPTLVKSLQKVVTRWDLPLELRIAAVSAHRLVDCNPTCRT